MVCLHGGTKKNGRSATVSQKISDISDMPATTTAADALPSEILNGHHLCCLKWPTAK